LHYYAIASPADIAIDITPLRLMIAIIFIFADNRYFGHIDAIIS